VTDQDGILFRSELGRLGGVQAVGYPLTGRFEWDGFTVQAFQRAVFQWRPECRCVALVNVFDRLHQLGHDDWLLLHRQTPRHDPGLGDASARLALLDSRPAIRAAYFAVAGDPVQANGLPTSRVTDMGNHYALRAQRVVFQEWKEDVPWAKAGQVTVALGGSIAQELGVLPSGGETSRRPHPDPPQPAAGDPPQPAAGQQRSHDWRSSGFVSAVGGGLYTADCRPFPPVGANVPNLPFRVAGATLEWLHRHGVRWLRVFATGHAPPPGLAPADADAAIRALRSLLARVDAFNAGRDPADALYVLVVLTDYYPPGVPGDRHALDHPTFQDSPVLPAPWFRAGVASFGFDQEHRAGRLDGLPNYEQHFRPWVQRVVPALRGDRWLMGWQIGNELKARGSPRNGIGSPQAYDWYLAFTRDVVDTIRALDRDHLVFLGAQYIAELVDWEYRPRDGFDPERVPEYRRLVERMLGACGRDCWNVWGLTAYDFNPYPIDDALLFGQAGVAVVTTELGFTLAPAEAARYGGDRPAAVRDGAALPWPTLDGRLEPTRWSVPDLIARTGMDAVAPWAAAAPGMGAEMDADPRRGIAGAPDADGLWSAWSTVATGLNTSARAASPSSVCLGLTS
jgi:hypothetical protein